MQNFILKSKFKATPDQKQAVEKLCNGLKRGKDRQTLLGVTGSGKTFTMANVIEKTQLPTLVISHNKTLAAQLYQEFRDFFPKNAVSYFVSYYDYYQPEAYIPSTDTYIEKETDINDEIDKLRLSATANLLTRKDVIVVASVSCIYNLGSPVEYGQYILELIEGQIVEKNTILSRLTDLQYERSDFELKRGTFQLKGDIILIWPAYVDYVLKIEMLDNEIQSIVRVKPLTFEKAKDERTSPIREAIYPAKHYLTNPLTQEGAIKNIKEDLSKRVKEFKKQKRQIEAFRIKQKVSYDLDMISKLGYVNGIENYSRYFDGRSPGQPPYTLLDYFKLCAKKNKTNGFLTIIDESHITLPQIRGMFRGDEARKQTLIDFGFRLPSALDNRPLQFTEFQRRVENVIHTSATPGDYEVSQSKGVVEQLIRPTGLIDPEVEIRLTKDQIPDLVKEILDRINKKQRVLVTTLTKKTAEALTDHLKSLKENGKKIKVQYLHSDVDTLDRVDILNNLRKGKYDVVVGINLLREGLDLPEVSLVAILDADKEGFLRSKTSLIQTMGRASRHINGKVIMYADEVTKSMKEAIKEVDRRRKIQVKYNRLHNIKPRSIEKPIRKQLLKRSEKQKITPTVIQISKKEAVDIKTLNEKALTPMDKKRLIRGLTRKMNEVARNMDFETAIKIRDTIERIKK